MRIGVWTLSLVSVVGLPLAVSHTMRAEQGIRLSGWTVDGDGVPLPDVDVRLACPQTGPGRRTTSDARGFFEIPDAMSGLCHLFGLKRGYVPADAAGDPGLTGQYNLRITGSREFFELRLRRGVIITGRLQLPQGVDPERFGAVVKRLRSATDTERYPSGRSGRVDSTGRFEFADIGPGDYIVLAVPAAKDGDAGGSVGYGLTYYPGAGSSADARPVTLKAGETRHLEFPMVRSDAYAIAGSAVDEGGRPLANMRVSLNNRAPDGWVRGRAITAADGSFIISGVQPGDYEVVFFRGPGDYGVESFKVVDADVRGIVVRAGTRR